MKKPETISRGLHKQLNTVGSPSVEEQGRAIARGIAEENARKERNQASAAKRQATMLENAAQRVFNQTNSG